MRATLSGHRAYRGFARRGGHDPDGSEVVDDLSRSGGPGWGGAGGAHCADRGGGDDVPHQVAKFQIVSKVHLGYDTVKAETFKQYVVFSLEKNRGGPALLDLEFQKDFPHYRFNAKGAFVAERLVDERVLAE